MPPRTLGLALTLLLAGACRATNWPPHRPPRWVVLGDSIAWDGRWVARLELAGLAAAGAEAPELVDAALPSETVSGLSEPEHMRNGFARPCLFTRLARVLDQARPDYVLVCYGMNDAIYQPLDEGRFAAYRRGIERLVLALKDRGIPFTLLTPPPFDATRATVARDADYDGVLASYSAWLVAQRARGWSVVDTHAELAERLAALRASEPDAAITSDGIHLDDRGHEWFAEATRHTLPPARQSAPDAGTPERLEQALALVRLRRDAWLTATGHSRPGLPAGLPLAEAEARGDALRAELLQVLATEKIR